MEHATIDDYVAQHHRNYRGYARALEPDRGDWRQVWDRIALGILSANARFDNACRAWRYATTVKGQVDPDQLSASGGGMTRAKATYLNALPAGPGIQAWLRQGGEAWHDYRLRLMDLKGLGLAKASFVACVLYPTTADVCCLDTWILRWAGHQGRRGIIRSVTAYRAIEARIRALGQRYALGTFASQWAIWDGIRGHQEPHGIFG